MLRDLGAYWIILGPITTATAIMLKDVFNVYMLLCGNNELIQKTVHSSMIYYVHVLPYNVPYQMLTC
jgi:hypothetical protein